MGADDEEQEMWEARNDFITALPPIESMSREEYDSVKLALKSWDSSALHAFASLLRRAGAR